MGGILGFSQKLEKNFRTRQKKKRATRDRLNSSEEKIYNLLPSKILMKIYVRAF